MSINPAVNPVVPTRLSDFTDEHNHKNWIYSHHDRASSSTDTSTSSNDTGTTIDLRPANSSVGSSLSRSATDYGSAGSTLTTSSPPSFTVISNETSSLKSADDDSSSGTVNATSYISVSSSSGFITPFGDSYSISATNTKSSSSTSTILPTQLQKHKNGGIIAGSVAGALVGVLLFSMAAFYYLRRRKKKRTPPSAEFKKYIGRYDSLLERYDRGPLQPLEELDADMYERAI